MESTVTQLLARRRFAVVLRTFAVREQDVPKRVEMVKATIDKIMALKPNPFCKILVVVWGDPNYIQPADCGLTAEALRRGIDPTNRIVGVVEFTHGDLFCGLLNWSIASLLRDRVDYGLILSPDAHSYLTQGVVDRMLQAICDGAKVMGLAINELTELTHRGRIANTFAMWHLVSLMAVGGFDLTAQLPRGDKEAKFMRGCDPDGKVVYYPLAGVEEVIPLARLVEVFGTCIIAPIDPDAVAKYIVPDPISDPDGYLRYLSKMGTKEYRQNSLLAEKGYDPSYLQGGVMVGYPK
ncbi:MAG: hypothetical protein ABII16_00225 [Patescibacteria group bacterium]